MLKFVAISFLLITIWAMYCREQNNNKSRHNFGSFVWPEFVSPAFGSWGSDLLGEVNHDYWRKL